MSASVCKYGTWMASDLVTTGSIYKCSYNIFWTKQSLFTANLTIHVLASYVYTILYHDNK